MKRAIRWAISNTPAMNTLMIGILVVGLASGFMLRREDFPRFELEIVLVTVAYPGASPDEIESGVCQKIEEAIRSIEGIKNALLDPQHQVVVCQLRFRHPVIRPANSLTHKGGLRLHLYGSRSQLRDWPKSLLC